MISPFAQLPHREHDAAQDRGSSEALVEPVHVPDAVEERHDQRAWTDGRGHVIGRRVEVAIAHGQHYQVVGAGEFGGGHHLDGHDLIGALAGEPQAARPHGGGALAAEQERHVPAGLGQPRAVIAPGRAGAHHENPHPEHDRTEGATARVGDRGRHGFRVGAQDFAIVAM